MHVCPRVWKADIDVGCAPQLLTTSFFDTKLLIDSRVHQLG